MPSAGNVGFVNLILSVAISGWYGRQVRYGGLTYLFSWLTYVLQSEEAPPALLLAQSAQMCARKGSLRKATLCYVAAANRLDKCGIVRLSITSVLSSLNDFMSLETFNDAFSSPSSRPL